LLNVSSRSLFTAAIRSREFVACAVNLNSNRCSPHTFNRKKFFVFYVISHWKTLGSSFSANAVLSAQISRIVSMRAFTAFYVRTRWADKTSSRFVPFGRIKKLHGYWTCPAGKHRALTYANLLPDAVLKSEALGERVRSETLSNSHTDVTFRQQLAGVHPSSNTRVAPPSSDCHRQHALDTRFRFFPSA